MNEKFEGRNPAQPEQAKASAIEGMIMSLPPNSEERSLLEAALDVVRRDPNDSTREELVRVIEASASTDEFAAAVANLCRSFSHAHISDSSHERACARVEKVLRLTNS